MGETASETDVDRDYNYFIIDACISIPLSDARLLVEVVVDVDIELIMHTVRYDRLVGHGSSSSSSSSTTASGGHRQN